MTAKQQAFNKQIWHTTHLRVEKARVIVMIYFFDYLMRKICKDILFQSGWNMSKLPATLWWHLSLSGRVFTTIRHVEMEVVELVIIAHTSSSFSRSTTRRGTGVPRELSTLCVHRLTRRCHFHGVAGSNEPIFGTWRTQRNCTRPRSGWGCPCPSSVHEYTFALCLIVNVSGNRGMRPCFTDTSLRHFYPEWTQCGSCLGPSIWHMHANRANFADPR